MVVESRLWYERDGSVGGRDVAGRGKQGCEPVEDEGLTTRWNMSMGIVFLECIETAFG